MAADTLPVFETLRERLRAASAHGGSYSDGSSAASVAAAQQFAEGVGDVLRDVRDDAAAAGDHTGASQLSTALAIWQLVALYFVEPGGGTGVVTEQLVEWFQRNASVLQFGPEALPARIGALVAAIQTAGPKPEEAPG